MEKKVQNSLRSAQQHKNESSGNLQVPQQQPCPSSASHTLPLHSEPVKILDQRNTLSDRGTSSGKADQHLLKAFV
jgi:hypothetical protein